MFTKLKRLRSVHKEYKLPKVTAVSRGQEDADLIDTDGEDGGVIHTEAEEEGAAMVTPMQEAPGSGEVGPRLSYDQEVARMFLNDEDDAKEDRKISLSILQNDPNFNDMVREMVDRKVQHALRVAEEDRIALAKHHMTKRNKRHAP